MDHHYYTFPKGFCDGIGLMTQGLWAVLICDIHWSKYSPNDHHWYFPIKVIKVGIINISFSLPFPHKKYCCLKFWYISYFLEYTQLFLMILIIHLNTWVIISRLHIRTTRPSQLEHDTESECTLEPLELFGVFVTWKFCTFVMQTKREQLHLVIV